MASWYRDEMVKRHLPADFDVKEELAKNVNALMTYRGYIKFLETDFARDPSRQGISNKQVKKANEITAKQMIARGVVGLPDGSLIFISTNLTRRHFQLLFSKLFPTRSEFPSTLPRVHISSRSPFYLVAENILPRGIVPARSSLMAPSPMPTAPSSPTILPMSSSTGMKQRRDPSTSDANRTCTIGRQPTSISSPYILAACRSRRRLTPP